MSKDFHDRYGDLKRSADKLEGKIHDYGKVREMAAGLTYITEVEKYLGPEFANVYKRQQAYKKQVR